jgi:hypothetical protein
MAAVPSGLSLTPLRIIIKKKMLQDGTKEKKKIGLYQ